MALSSPLEVASYKMNKTTYSSLSRVFDTFRIHEEAMNFSDKDGSGWRIFGNVVPPPGLVGKRDLEAEAALLLGMIKLSSFELKTYGFGHTLANMLESCLHHPVSNGSSDLLLHIGGADLINHPLPSLTACEDVNEGYPILHLSFIKIRIAEGLSQVLSKGPDLFRSAFNGITSPRKETPTSLAMYTSRTFESWRDGLISVGVDVEKFIKQELEKNQLVHTGWRSPTLLHVFSCDHSEYKSTQNFRDCSDCARDINSVIVQPHWRHRLERIRQGLDPDLPVQDDSEANDTELTGLEISTDTLGSPYELVDEIYGIEDGALHSDTLSSPGTDPALAPQRHFFLGGDPHGYPRMVSLLADCVYGRHEFVCMNCWLHYVRTGTRRQSGPRKRLPSWIVRDSSSDRSFTSEDESLELGVSDVGSSEDEASEDGFSPYLIHT